MNIMLCAFLYLRSRTYVVENTNLIHQNGTFTSTLELVNAGTCILRPTCLLRPSIKVPIYTRIHDTKLYIKTTCPLRPF